MTLYTPRAQPARLPKMQGILLDAAMRQNSADRVIILWDRPVFGQAAKAVQDTDNPDAVFTDSSLGRPADSGVQARAVAAGSQNADASCFWFSLSWRFLHLN